MKTFQLLKQFIDIILNLKKSRILVKCIPEILLLKKILQTGPQYNIYLQNNEVLTERIDYNSIFGIKLRQKNIQKK